MRKWKKRENELSESLLKIKVLKNRREIVCEPEIRYVPILGRSLYFF